jgi:hypothetical protein
MIDRVTREEFGGGGQGGTDQAFACLDVDMNGYLPPSESMPCTHSSKVPLVANIGLYFFLIEMPLRCQRHMANHLSRRLIVCSDRYITKEERDALKVKFFRSKLSQVALCMCMALMFAVFPFSRYYQC